MTSKEALENITDWIEYFTRLDYVEPEVRGEVKQKFYEAYHKTSPELELIEKDLKVLEEMREYIKPIDYGEEYQNRYALQVGSVIYHLLMKEDYNRWVRWLGNDK